LAVPTNEDETTGNHASEPKRGRSYSWRSSKLAHESRATLNELIQMIKKVTELLPCTRYNRRSGESSQS